MRRKERCMGVKDTDTYSEEETARRAAATLKVMLATPHKSHKACKPKQKRD